MNKILISSLVVVSALTFVSAEESQVAPTPARPVFVKSTKIMTASATLMRKEMEKPRPIMASGTPMMGGEGMMTGDPILDEKVRTLRKEMDEKIRVIRTEYEEKIKTLLADKKMARASTTEMRREEMKDKMMNGSGTPLRMEGERPRPQMASGTPPKVENKRPPQNMIKRFFQSFLGGTPSDAYADQN